MKFLQKEIRLKPYNRGFHIITNIIEKELVGIESIKTGIVHIFIKHTSAGLTINDNADMNVRDDFESYFNVHVPEDAPYYKHTLEGPDDMPAHIKASMLGSTVSIPVTNGKLNLGIWQGIYLCEHRNFPSGRELVLTAYGI